MRPGDTLWDIAESELGDGAEWPVLARHNWAESAGGTRLVDPDHYEQGGASDCRASEDAGAEGHTSGQHHGVGHDARDRHLPELVALGLGFLTCAALARRAGRRRRLHLFTGTRRHGALSEAGTDAATLLGRFTDLPALSAFEVANCMLARALHNMVRPQHPEVRAVCVSPEGVTFWFDCPNPMHPEGSLRWRTVWPGESTTGTSTTPSPTRPLRPPRPPHR